MRLGAGVSFVGGGGDLVLRVLDAHQDLHAAVGVLALVHHGQHPVRVLRLLHHLLRVSLAVHLQLVRQSNSLLLLFAEFSGMLWWWARLP